MFKMHDLESAEITGAVLSSVVPELTGKIKTAVNKVCGIGVQVTDADVLGQKTVLSVGQLLPGD